MTKPVESFRSTIYYNSSAPKPVLSSTEKQRLARITSYNQGFSDFEDGITAPKEPDNPYYMEGYSSAQNIKQRI